MVYWNRGHSVDFCTGYVLVENEEVTMDPAILVFSLPIIMAIGVFLVDRYGWKLSRLWH
jgi:hydrogenase-4 membrane subunit HyfE